MKIYKPILCIGIASAIVSFAVSNGLGTGIATSGSPHNFVDDIGGATELGATGWNGREELCRVCHVPHDHDRAEHYGDSGLLWNHGMSSATYTMYSSSTMDGSIAAQPTGYSKMCLGCHDGTVGIDTFDKYAGGTVFIDDYDSGFQVPGGQNYQAGGILSLFQTHPLSVEYNSTLDPNLHPKTNSMGASGSIEDVLENGTTVQCSTCHDVHDQPGESVPGTHLLRVSQKASQGPASGLCLTCHIK